ncbi:ATP-dependent zinc metalloprotease FtsH 3-like [Periplaneta americana]|uniref:ATP-dependent zinc metalloprotease FtsH 3-like n=1 Tax=Periplaneta americana TaxID=6978 RepID=UPI0037E84934
MRQVSSSGNRAFNFVKSNAKRYNPDNEGKVTFNDIAGYKEAKTELSEIVDFLKNPEKYQKLGAKIPKGILLSGAPGTGKTLFAKAVAGEAERPFFSISGSEFVELFVGVAASRVRDLFDNAKKVAPAIIFIDELDAIGRMRGVGNGGGNDEKEQALNQILVEMDGFNKDTNVIVLAATNRADVLDPALLRPGRFDRQIRFENPNEQDRLAILQLHAKSKPIDPKIDFTQISKDISGFSGAEIANLINEALLISARKNKPFADAEDIREAQEKVTKQKNNLASEPPTFFGRSKAKFYDATSKPATTFKDVAGVYEAKEELVEVIDFLKKPEKYTALGARIPKGILLTGAPGTGKTLLAKAVAGEAGRPFFSVSGSDFIEMYVGVGASRVRDLFDNAKKNAPCIVFIDEIDAIGKKRGSNFGGGNDERDNTLNQILVEMDGFNTSDTVIVLASTNRADILDPALLRPGRFDRQVTVEKPDLKAREDILKVHARNKPLSTQVDLKELARGTTGFSGAELANLLNEAALLTARDNRTEITPIDIDNAKDKVLMGPEKKNMLMLERDKINTAYHEAAHAIVAHYLPHTDPVYKVTIIPRGRALGVTQQLPIDDKQGYTKTYLLNRISILMAGRIGEEIRFGQGEITTGASSDIDVATQMAQRYVTQFGMSEKLGMIHYEQNSYEGKGYSEETAKMIDEEIRRIIDQQYKVAYDLLETHKDKLTEMSNILLEKETIDEDEIIEILGVKPGVAELRAEVDAEYQKLLARQKARGIHYQEEESKEPTSPQEQETPSV